MNELLVLVSTHCTMFVLKVFVSALVPYSRDIVICVLVLNCKYVFNCEVNDLIIIIIIIISNYSSCDVNVPIGLLRTRVPFSSCDVNAA